MGNISAHVSRSEVECPCGTCNVAVADYTLITTIEDVCDYFLTLPKTTRIVAHFNSWNRCAEYDLEMKRREGIEISLNPSQHTLFWAVDFWLETVSSNGKRTKILDSDIADYLEKQYPSSCGIGRYANRTHIDMRATKARWGKR